MSQVSQDALGHINVQAIPFCGHEAIQNREHRVPNVGHHVFSDLSLFQFEVSQNLPQGQVLVLQGLPVFPERPLTRFQRLLGQFPLVDIRAGPQPADDPPFRIVHGHCLDEVPAILPVLATANAQLARAPLAASGDVGPF